MENMEPTATTSEATAGKRKRTDSSSAPPPSAPAAKASKVSSNQLSINYLARQSQEDLPLINKDDALPNLLQLLSAYSSILDRHESLASNLGARPLGPILIKRFERCFDASPKVIASHHKGAASNPEEAPHSITWLEVIEFARSHPSQFTLSTFSEGKRVCQFYYPTKQLRVQISEEDFLFINSGRCQELIPPLPIWEDEEKEVGACDVLEAKLKELTNAADMVAARTRQLGHRLKGRKAAILERRAEGGSGTPAKSSAVQGATPHPSSTGGGGFTAVNAANDKISSDASETNLGSSVTVRNELLKHFESLPHNQSQGRAQSRHHSIITLPDINAHSTKPMDPTHGLPHETGETSGQALSAASSLSPVPPNAFEHNPLGYSTQEPASAPRLSISYANTTGHRPSLSAGTQGWQAAHQPLKHNFSRPLPPALESSQPFRPLCQAHMDALPRGQRVLPPCDRCRRLRMDCVKNLTSCAGCTRKHARCHWREVTRDEIAPLDHLMDSIMPVSPYNAGASAYTNGYGNGGSDLAHSDDGLSGADETDDEDSNPLEDLEALGEKEEREREDEEGLRNARELARMGWEESLRSAQKAHHSQSVDQARGYVDHAVAANAHANAHAHLENKILHHHQPVDEAGGHIDRAVPADTDAHSNLENGTSHNLALPPEDAHSAPAQATDQAAQLDVMPALSAFAGFRPVNGSY